MVIELNWTQLNTIIHITNVTIPALTEIKENSFSGLNNLRELALVGNQFTEIKKKTFIGLNNLEELYLVSNKLKEIKENAFFGLHKLDKLSLKDNLLTEINEKTFFGLNNLYKLSLEDNKLTEIKENTFNGLEYLRVFLLGNQLTRNTYFNLRRIHIDRDIDSDRFDRRSNDRYKSKDDYRL